MAYIDQRGFTDSFDNQKNINEKYIDSDPGPYVGVVKATVDPLRMGRLGVNIPALTNTTNPTIENIVWCQYLSPFYGAKSINATSKTDPYDYKSTQHSYGFWAVPPDIDTEVLVIFAKGETSSRNAFWIGCVQQPLTNQMVPGYGSKEETRLPAGGTDFSQTKQQVYGTDLLPAGEKNRRLNEGGDTIESSNSFRYPVNDILADQLVDEGLIADPVRGTTTSSARRESPSQVFGISTPGRIRSDSRKLNIGLNGTVVTPDRNIGHSLVMDDGAVDGTNQLTRLRTASGHQLLMHDTEGVVYIANGSGKAWIEMSKNGKISIYSDKGIDIRAEGDFNIHSDANINFHAKEKIRFNAEQDLALSAEGYIYSMGQKGVLTSAQKGSVRQYAKDGITSYTDGPQLHGASGRIDLAGSQVHFNSVRPRSSWGPGWLKPDSAKVGIKITESGTLDIDAQQPLINGKPNRIKGKTTIKKKSYITHEPFSRPAGGRDKDDIA